MPSVVPRRPEDCPESFMSLIAEFWTFLKHLFGDDEVPRGRPAVRRRASSAGKRRGGTPARAGRPSPSSGKTRRSSSFRSTDRSAGRPSVCDRGGGASSKKGRPRVRVSGRPPTGTKGTARAVRSRGGRKKDPNGSRRRAAPSETPIGEVTHYFSKIMVGVIRLDGTIRIGDRIRVRGVDFVQEVTSLQIESRDVRMGRRGQLVGLKLDRKASVGAHVLRLKPSSRRMAQ